MKKSGLFIWVVIILLGVFLIVYEGIDDSPGGQFIGLLVIIISVVGLIKSKE